MFTNPPARFSPSTRTRAVRGRRGRRGHPGPAGVRQGPLRHRQACGDSAQPHRLRGEHHRSLGRPRPDRRLRHRAQRLDRPDAGSFATGYTATVPPNDAVLLTVSGTEASSSTFEDTTATTPAFGNVTAASAGTKLIDITHANGGSTVRKGTVQVNGQYKYVVAFSPTGSATTFRTVSLLAHLAKGANSVKFAAISGSTPPTSTPVASRAPLAPTAWPSSAPLPTAVWTSRRTPTSTPSRHSCGTAQAAPTRSGRSTQTRSEP